MNAMRMILALAVGTVGACGALAGPQAVANKAKRPHAAHGVVVAVQTGDDKDKDTDLGSITVKIHLHKKKTAAAAPAYVERKFEVDAKTAFERVIIVGKGQRKTEPAKFEDIHKGEHVAVVAKKGPEHLALKVAIIVRQKAKAAPVK